MDEQALLIELLKKYKFILPGEKRMYFHTICGHDIFVTTDKPLELIKSSDTPLSIVRPKPNFEIVPNRV